MAKSSEKAERDNILRKLNAGQCCVCGGFFANKYLSKVKVINMDNEYFYYCWAHKPAGEYLEKHLTEALDTFYIPVNTAKVESKVKRKKWWKYLIFEGAK